MLVLPMKDSGKDISFQDLKGAVMTGSEDRDITLKDIPLKKVEGKSSSDITLEELEFIKAIEDHAASVIGNLSVLP